MILQKHLNQEEDVYHENPADIPFLFSFFKTQRNRSNYISWTIFILKANKDSSTNILSQAVVTLNALYNQIMYMN